MSAVITHTPDDNKHNIEASDLDFEFHSTDWNVDGSSFDEHHNTAESFNYNIPSLTSDSYPSLSLDASAAASVQTVVSNETKHFSTPDPSTGYYDLQLSFQENNGNFMQPSSSNIELEIETTPSDIQSSSSQGPSFWDSSPDLREHYYSWARESPELDLGILENEWERVGGTDILCKLVPECSKELLNLFKIPGQAKRRRYLTVRDMLNIKDKLNKVKTILSKGETSSTGISPSPVDIFSPSSNITVEEVLSVDGNETTISSTLSPSVESCAEEPTVKKPRTKRVRRRSFSDALSAPETQIPANIQSNPQNLVPMNPHGFTLDDPYKRPRHFDFSLLQIGSFQLVTDPRHPNQLCRLKVISSAQKFVYEFEIPARVAASEPDLVLVTRVVSIEVPFASVTGMWFSESCVQVTVSSKPFAFVGFRTTFPGQSKCCVYEKISDTDFTEGELGRCAVHYIVFSKAEIASRLHSHLISCSPIFSLSLQSQLPQQNADLTENTQKADAENAGKPSESAIVTTMDPASDKGLVATICSCKVSCRSKRCSCARQGKLCSNCRCIGCENPLNVLQNHGIDVEWAKSSHCLMNSIYLLHSKNLVGRLQQKLQCPSCGFFEQVNALLKSSDTSCCSECFVQLGYSWCRDQLFIVTQGKCRHCVMCRKCVDSARGESKCPRCLVPFLTDSSKSFP